MWSGHSVTRRPIRISDRHCRVLTSTSSHIVHKIMAKELDSWIAQSWENMRTHLVDSCCRMDIWWGRTVQLTWPIHSGREVVIVSEGVGLRNSREVSGY